MMIFCFLLELLPIEIKSFHYVFSIDFAAYKRFNKHIQRPYIDLWMIYKRNFSYLYAFRTSVVLPTD